MLPSLNKKGYSTLVTAKKATQTTDMLEALNVPYRKIGDYGETIKEKLRLEQERTLQFIDLFEEIGTPKVLWSHGDVSAIRTAFGLGIPIVYANDTVFAYHVAKLVTSLVDWLIAPVSFGKSWSKFGIPKSRIILYDGLEEVAWMKNPKFENPKFLKELNDQKPLVLFRDAEYKASYFNEISVNTLEILKELTKIATVVYLPRYEKEKQQIESLENIWIPPKPVLTAQLIPYIDLMIGSGGTACRETAMSGIPTINFHFWDVQARYLHEKGFPIQIIRNTKKIIKTAKKILQDPQMQKVEAEEKMKSLESPIRYWIQYIETCLKQGRSQ